MTEHKITNGYRYNSVKSLRVFIQHIIIVLATFGLYINITKMYFIQSGCHFYERFLIAYQIL